MKIKFLVEFSEPNEDVDILSTANRNKFLNCIENSIDILSLNSYSSTSSTSELITANIKSMVYFFEFFSLSRGSSKVSSQKPTPPVRRYSSISSNHYAPTNQQLYQVENNYDDLHSIHSFRVNEIQKSLQVPKTMSMPPPAPPPPPPPPLPSMTTNHDNSFDFLPPPPDSFYSDTDCKPIINEPTKSTSSCAKQSVNKHQQQQQTHRQTQSVHQVLMTQIQYGVKLKPANRAK